MAISNTDRGLTAVDQFKAIVISGETRQLEPILKRVLEVANELWERSPLENSLLRGLHIYATVRDGVVVPIENGEIKIFLTRENYPELSLVQANFFEVDTGSRMTHCYPIEEESFVRKDSDDHQLWLAEQHRTLKKYLEHGIFQLGVG